MTIEQYKDEVFRQLTMNWEWTEEEAVEALSKITEQDVQIVTPQNWAYLMHLGGS